MSIDLDWSSLDAKLTASVVNFLTNAFASAARPSWLGDVTVDSFSFGDSQPEMELLDLRDVYKQFLQDDDDEEEVEDEVVERVIPTEEELEGLREEELEKWETERRNEFRRDNEAISSRPNGPIRPGLFSQASSPLFSPGLHHSLASTRQHGSTSSLPLFEEQETERRRYDHHDYPTLSEYSSRSSSPSSHHQFEAEETSSPPRALPKSSSQPSLQLHLLVKYRGNMNVGLSTALLINYPSPLFMSLPLKLSVTSIAFEGTFIVAFEGDRRRVHLSIVDPTKDGEDVEWNYNYSNKGNITAGARLLHSAAVDSEVGQSDKHVLKNVGKVEKFVLDVMRSTLESELVFPNYQTVMF